MNTLTARACIRYGWETFLKRPWFFIGAMFVYLIAIFVLDAISATIFAHIPGLKAVVLATFHVPVFIAPHHQITQITLALLFTSIVNLIISAVASMGLIAFALKAHDDIEHVSLRDLWHPWPLWRYLGTYIPFAFMVYIGLILFVVPGVILGIIFSFAVYLVIDRKQRPLAALKESARLTEGHRWMLLRLTILLFLIILVAIIPLLLATDTVTSWTLGIGALIALPIFVLSITHAYRRISSTNSQTASEPVIV